MNNEYIKLIDEFEGDDGKTMKKYEMDSDKFIKWLEDNDYIAKLGVGNRNNDEYKGFFSDVLVRDNTFNHEYLVDGNVFEFSNNFCFYESGNLLILSKHIGEEDVRAGYDDDVIYIKDENMLFSVMIYSFIEGYILGV